jgi:hypothetical protein
VIDVDLPRPRERDDTAFLAMRAGILELLHFGGKQANK